MTTFLFWNLNKKPLQSLIAKLVEEHEIDVLIFAECLIKADVLLKSINRPNRKYIFSPGDKCERIEIYTRFSPEFSKPVLEKREFTIRHLKSPDQIDILLTAIHFPSKLYWSDANQAMKSVEVANEIKTAESRAGHSRTVLVGDLNMNPFEDGIISANGFHAVMSQLIAQRQSRVVQGERYPFFYNPMWSLFGDAPQGPPGTYYYGTSGLITFFWNMFDQVFIRPELLSSFSHENLKILTTAGNTSLLAKDGRPNSKRASDHLPLLLSLDLQKETTK